MPSKAKIGFSLFSCVYLVTTAMSGDALARRRLVPDMPSVEIHYEALMALKAVPQESSTVQPSLSGWQQGAPKITPPSSAPQANPAKPVDKNKVKAKEKSQPKAKEVPPSVVNQPKPQKKPQEKTQDSPPEKHTIDAPASEPVPVQIEKSPVKIAPVAANPVEKVQEQKPVAAALEPTPKPEPAPKSVAPKAEATVPLQPAPAEPLTAPKDGEGDEALPPLARKEAIVKELQASAEDVAASASAPASDASQDDVLPPLQPVSPPSQVAEEAKTLSAPPVTQPVVQPQVQEDEEVLPAIAVPVSPTPPAAAVIATPTAPVDKATADDDDDAPMVVAPVQKEEGFLSGLKKATKKLIGSEEPKMQAKPRPTIPLDDEDEDVPAAKVVTPPATPNAAGAPVAPVVVDADEDATPLPPLPKTGQAASVDASQDIAALHAAKGSELPSLELLKSKHAPSQDALGSVAAAKDEPLPPLPATSSSAPKVALQPSDTPFGKPSMEAVKPSKPVPAPVGVVESEELPPLPADVKAKLAAQVVMPSAAEEAAETAPTQLASLDAPAPAAPSVDAKSTAQAANVMAAIAFAEGEIQIPKGQESALKEVAKQKQGMVLVLAYADPKSNNTNVRHEALARALAIRALLIDSGMASKNIRTEVKSDAIPAGAANRVDLISDGDED